ARRGAQVTEKHHFMNDLDLRANFAVVVDYDLYPGAKFAATVDYDFDLRANFAVVVDYDLYPGAKFAATVDYDLVQELIKLAQHPKRCLSRFSQSAVQLA